MELGRADVASQLKKLLALRGAVPLDLSSELIPVVNAFNLDEPPYHAKRGGYRGQSLAAGGVGLFGKHHLKFPLNISAGITGVCRYIILGATATPTLYLIGVGDRQADQALNNFGTTWQGLPEGGIGSTTAYMSSGNQVGAHITPGMAIRCPAQSSLLIPGPFVWNVETMVEVTDFTANENTEVNFYWDEYDLG